MCTGTEISHITPTTHKAVMTHISIAANTKLKNIKENSTFSLATAHTPKYATVTDRSKIMDNVIAFDLETYSRKGV